MRNFYPVAPPELNPLPREAQYRLYKKLAFAIHMRRIARYKRAGCLCFAVVFVCMMLLLFNGAISIEAFTFIYIVLSATGIVTMLWTSRSQFRSILAEVCDPDGRLPVCAMCDYNLRGIHGDRCPECGTTIFVNLSVPK